MKKYCYYCSKKKLTKLFYICNRNKDHCQSMCKECTKLRWKLDAKKHFKTRILRKRIFREKNRDYYNAQCRSYYAKNPNKFQKSKKRSDLKYPEKKEARIKFALALKKGLIKKKPCEICGAKKVQAHHLDYTKPFLVKWLCSLHHGIAHRIILSFLIIFLSSCALDPQVVINNDVFTLNNKDRYYTNGLKLTTSTFDGNNRLNGSIGQDIYTPAKKTIATPQLDDRPYSAYLYAESSYEIPDPKGTDIYTVQAGIVGPHAYGEEVQNGFHRLIGDDLAQGWANQIHDEPTLNFYLDRVIPDFATLTVGKFKTFTYLGAALGNVLTDAHIGGETQALLYQNENFSVTAAVAGNTSYIGQDIFLDGNTFRDSQSVNKDTVRASARAGVQAEYHKFFVRFAYIGESPQFAKQGDGYHYGSVLFGFNSRVDFPILGW